MKIVDGTMVPPGKRGFLFAKFVYEEQLKLKTARRLDKIKEAHRRQGETIAADAELQRMRAREQRPDARDPASARRAQDGRASAPSCSSALGSKETDVGKLLAAFFETDDAELPTSATSSSTRSWRRCCELYRVRVGDMLTIKAFTSSGYVQSVNVQVYGTFQFKGLEKSRWPARST